MIMFLDNDVIWHPPLAAWHRGHTWARPWPLTSPHPAPCWATYDPVCTELFSHFQSNAAPNSRHFLSVLFLFFQAETGDREWRVTRGWRREDRGWPVPGLCPVLQARLCPVSPLYWPLQSSPGAALCTLESVSCDWTCSKFQIVWTISWILLHCIVPVSDIAYLFIQIEANFLCIKWPICECDIWTVRVRFPCSEMWEGGGWGSA